MSQLTTLPKGEIEKVSKQFSADAGYTYNEKLLHTVDDCVEQYNKADEVSRIAQTVIKDRMQGSALLKAKKLICGDEWNRNLTHKTSEKWKSFFTSLGATRSNVDKLLDFAGYKEAEERLIEAGVEVEPINTASHYREAKRLTDIPTPEAVATTYTQAIEANDGEIPSTAKEVKEVINASKNKVSSEDLFLRENPEFIDIEIPISAMAFGSKLIELLPSCSNQEFKDFYRTVAKYLHPDNGGNHEAMIILTSINDMMEFVYKQRAINEAKNLKMKKYEDWCNRKGCGVYDWIEDDSQ